MHNPRWPYRLRAYRAVLDGRGIPVTDAEGNPVTEAVSFEAVVYGTGYDPRFHPDGSYVTETVTELPWGRRTATGGISRSGEVFYTDFKISCPKFLTPLPQGTVLHLIEDDDEYDAVVEKKTDTNWGANIWFKNPGNNGTLSGQE